LYRWHGLVANTTASAFVTAIALAGLLAWTAPETDASEATDS
jgi:hypothetical protein